MNKITDEEIQKHLELLYNEAQNNMYGCEVLGVFAYGLPLYGHLNDIKDLQVITCIIPVFEDICLGTNVVYDCENNITDIRTLITKFQEQDLKIMECVFSKYKIINKKYKNIYDKYINMNKERLFHYDPQTRLKNALARGYKAIDEKNWFEAVRIQMACNLYLQGTSIENCINIKEPVYLDTLENYFNGAYIPSQEIMIKSYKKLENRIDEMDYETDYSAYEIAVEFITNIIKESLKKENTIEDFYNSLTKSEKIAWAEIVNEINNYYGIISISQMVEKSEVSRPVFKSTLDKMEKYGVAEIVNMGVKGTQITMLK